ncbi:MAG: minor capsid protein [Spirochaetaceae bacterium]|nr:minor capsid protein [Spirochaetaceae bacterium]
MIEAVEKLIGSSYMLGLIHAEEENPEHKINAADEEIPPVAFEEAMNFLKAKVPMTKAEWLALEPKLRFRAFTVAKLGEAEVVDNAKKILLKALAKGESYASTWEDLKHRIDTDALGIKPGYWENVFRTNTQSAYIAGKLQQYENTNVAAYQLLVIEDSRTSRICRHLLTASGYGMILLKNHTFWKKYGFPPYHFQCRTSIRAVWPAEIGTYGNNIDNPSMKSLTKFKPLSGFGGNPLSKGSFWLMTESMKDAALKFDLVPDILKMAHSLGLSNYDFELAGNFAKPQQLQNTKYKVKVLKKAKPKQKEILTAKILEENGHTVVMLPEVGLQNISNPDALIDYDIVADFKVPDGSSFTAVRGAVSDADAQEVTHMVFYPRTHTYTKKEALREIKYRLKNTKFLKEVWVIWDGEIITLKK